MKEMMDALAKLYEKSSASNKVFLMKRLFNMNMSEGGLLQIILMNLKWLVISKVL
jgi:hypothetical protein